MSVNYYTDIGKCSSCGRAENTVHLGKSSSGWKFLFNFNGGAFYNDFDEFVEFIQNKDIYTENGHIVEVADLLETIRVSQNDKSHDTGGALRDDPFCRANLVWRDGYEFLDAEFD